MNALKPVDDKFCGRTRLIADPKQPFRLLRFLARVGGHRARAAVSSVSYGFFPVKVIGKRII